MKLTIKYAFVATLFAMFCLVLTAPTSAAQDAAKPPVAPAPTTAPAPQAPAPTPSVSQQDQQVFATLAYRAQVQAEMVAVLQKEIDSTNAEMGRLVQRLKAEGYDLTRDQKTGQLIYQPSAPPKK